MVDAPRPGGKTHGAHSAGADYTQGFTERNSLVLESIGPERQRTPSGVGILLRGKIMRKIAIVVLIVIVAVCGIGGYVYKLRLDQAALAQKAAPVVKVEKGTIESKVVESGSIDAIKSVDVRSRASGRLKQLFVDEGDFVKQGELIAIIDPLEIQLQVDQNRAQLSGAKSGVARTALEIEKTRINAQANLAQAERRLAVLKAELDIQPTLTDASIRSARANLNTSEQQLRQLVETTQPNERVATDSELREARAGAETASRELERIRDLEAKGYVATRQLDATLLDFERARSRLERAQEDAKRLEQRQRLAREQAEQAVLRAQAELDRVLANRIQDANKRREYENAIADVRKSEAALADVQILQKSREQSQASVAQLQSQLSDTERQLRETEIRAPMDGVIAARFLEVGDLVSGLSAFAQGTTIVRIEDRNALQVELQINEIDVARLRLDMPADITVDAFPNDTFKGHVKKIAPSSVSSNLQQAASDAVVKYKVEIWIDEVSEGLRSGMTAKCTLVTLSLKNVLRVPREYLGQDEEGYFVMLAPEKAAPGAKAKKQAVKVGDLTGAFAQIVSGVKEGAILARPEYKGPKRQGFMEAGVEE